MKKIIYTSLTFFLCLTLNAQELIVEKFIPLNFSANDFSINENRNSIFLTSAGTNEILKIDLNGKVQKKIGGFGWNYGQFDFPASIVSTAIDIYVADYNNHRIQRFDHNLNFISSLQSSDKLNFEFPISISLSNKGDLYILDSRNKRVLKINAFNRVERTFGNYESGNVILSNPTVLKIDKKQVIYILDETKIFLFDEYGNYLKTISIPDTIKEKVIDLFPDISTLFLLTSKNVYKLTDEVQKINFSEINDSELIFKRIDVRFGRVYLLTSEGIFICQIKY
ncbi:MAG: NHL repeat-containing protein [Ignavibacteria bacterium]|nr:NHL repeat-containing protein [Ignavibacteria bacterium]